MYGHAFLALAVVALILLSGCAQIAGSMQDCLDKCFEVCKVVKASNVSLDSYTVSLKKESGGTTVECSCSCAIVPA